MKTINSKKNINISLHLYLFLAILLIVGGLCRSAIAENVTEKLSIHGEDALNTQDKEESENGTDKLAPFVNKLLERYGISAEYLESGEPRCSSCHTKEMRPAIDYTTDAECLQCHNVDYSQRFLDIDERYKVDLDEVTESYRQPILDDFAQVKKSIVAQPKKAYRVPERMVLVHSGEFIMGTDDWWPKSGPEHKRVLPDFFFDTYEVTNKEYMEFVMATKHRIPDHWKANNGEIPSNKEEHPVTYVNWFDSEAYCKWRGKRLPTEAEWEKAARGPDGRTFPWGNQFEKNKANTPQYGHNDTMPVGSFVDGQSFYGVHDLAGNVFEWTSDWYKAYPGSNHPDPNQGERYRVVRGGSWYDCTYYKCGISAPTYNRIFFNSFTQNNNFGIRCMKDVE